MGEIINAPEGLVALRDVFGQSILELGEKNSKLFMLDADLASSTRTMAFGKRFPDRHLNVGIAEQNMVGIAAGLSLRGYIPFVNTFASFLTRRACDQIAISVAYPQMNVKFFGFHGGINLGEDGATQQAVEDIAIMQAIAGIRVYSPVDGHDLKRVMHEVMDIKGPTYVRLSRFPSAVFTDKPSSNPEKIEDFIQIHDGEDILIFTTGTLSSHALDAVKKLSDRGVSAKLIAITRLKPLGESLIDLIKQSSDIPMAVIEEHSVYGGLAAGLSERLDAYGILHCFHRIAIQDRFGESGEPNALLEAFGLAGKNLEDRLYNIAKGFQHLKKGG